MDGCVVQPDLGSWKMVGTHTGEYFGIAATGRAISVEQCEVYESTPTRAVG